jgi:hypothetical protein
LATANVVHVLTTLLESIDFGEDSIFLEGPHSVFIAFSFFINNFFEIFKDIEPLVTEIDRVVELFDAALYISVGCRQPQSECWSY